MRASAIVHEAVLNIASGATRTVLFALGLSLAAGALACADIVSVSGIEHQAEAFQRAGGNTMVYTAPGLVDGAKCDALGSVPGVSAAGAIRAANDNEVSGALPSTTIPTFDVSPRFGGFTALGSLGIRSGVFVSSELAATLGVSWGERLQFQSGSTVVASVYDYAQDGRQPGLGYAVLIPTDTTQPFDGCWVEVWPQLESINQLMSTVLVPGALASAQQPPQLQQLNASLGTRFDGSGAFAARVSRFAPALAAVMAFVLGMVAIRLRRLELAAARHAGVTLRAQTFQVLLETASWALTGVMMALLAVAVVVATAGTSDSPALFLLGLRVLIPGIIAAISGALLATLLTRENHLFAYFKDR